MLKQCCIYNLYYIVYHKNIYIYKIIIYLILIFLKTVFFSLKQSVKIEKSCIHIAWYVYNKNSVNQLPIVPVTIKYNITPNQFELLS